MECDYNKIILYDAGEFNKQYKTDVWSKVKILPFVEIEDDETRKSFLHSEYKLVEALESIVLYRTFGRYGGKGSRAGGAYATTEFAESIIDVKIRLALLPEWRNTKMYEAKFIVPKGERFFIGIAAPQVTKSGEVLQGGAEQIFIPRAIKNWNTWVLGYRRITSRQLDAPPEYPLSAVNEEVNKTELYALMCPKCTCSQVEKLHMASEEGGVGESSDLVYRCCNTDCGYMW